MDPPCSVLCCGRDWRERPTASGAVHHVLPGAPASCVPQLIRLWHPGDAAGSLLSKSHKDAAVEEETISLMLIALEMIKMPSFSPFTGFFGRVKLVHLVLLVLVVVLEREENLVLRVMPAHLGPRYINNT